MTWRRKLLLTCALALAAFILCAAIRPLRYKVFPWTVARVLETTLLDYPPWDVRFVRVEPGEQVEVPAPDGRRLPADFFRAVGEARGRILLVHGSIPKGRRFSPYPFIARAFAEQGYDVLLPDIGGYGEARIAPDAVPRFGADVAAAARALQDLSRAGAGPVVIGHSLGGSMALQAVVHHGLVPARLVLWDPPLSGELSPEAATDPGTIRRLRSELQVEGGGASQASAAALGTCLARLEPLALLAALPEPRVPTLAALGSLVRDHEPLLDTVGRASRWITVLDMSGVDHFLDMVSLGADGGWLLYRPGNCRLFTGSVVKWLRLGQDGEEDAGAPLEGDD